MPRKVENPFKEQGLPAWIRYLATGLTGFLVAYVIFGPNAAPPSAPSQIETVSNLRKSDDGVRKTDDTVQNVQTDDAVVADDQTDDSIDGSDDPEFPDLDQEEYLDWVRTYYQNLSFESHPPPSKLTKEILEESVNLGCDYLAANQKEEGNFNYQYDFVKQTQDPDDSPVRQAGALWGMALCFQKFPNNSNYKLAVEKGIAFFQKHTTDGPVPGSSMIEYPGEDSSESGSNALYGLALIEYIRTVRDNKLEGLGSMEMYLGKIIRFLKFLQNDDLHIAQEYDFEDEEKSDNHSPYYDGETMLCFVKAAKYLGDESLVPIIEEMGPVVAKAYTLDAWRIEHDSSETKGFYQWSSMVFAEYYDAEWENYEFFGDYVLMLSHWIIHTHNILDRRANTGYAYEGILSALAIARDRDARDVVSDLEHTIDEGIYKLTSWQVGGPLAHTNKFLKQHPTNEKIAVGGIMNAKNKAPLRIDTTQHQMHALIMTLELLYP